MTKQPLRTVFIVIDNVYNRCYMRVSTSNFAKDIFMPPRAKPPSPAVSSEAPAYIRSLRKELGMTQEALAEKLGVSFASVNRWENDQTKPNALALEKLHKLEATMSAKENPSGDAPDAALTTCRPILPLVPTRSKPLSRLNALPLPIR
jgi:transcriptional regulator with XRE-family HTH domain